jgi:ATP-dependent Clp protease adaptor protein ClpS
MAEPRDPQSPGSADPELLTEERTETRRPRRFRVLLHNDDFTTMQFVVDVLVRYFHKSATVAMQIMLEVHTKGRGVAGIYTRDVAETKAAQVTTAAREAGFPLRLSVEPEPS